MKMLKHIRMMFKRKQYIQTHRHRVSGTTSKNPRALTSLQKLAIDVKRTRKMDKLRLTNEMGGWNNISRVLKPKV